MGIYDRGYYDGDSWKGDSANGGRPSFRRTMIGTIILINVIVFLVDMFSPKVTFTETITLPNGQTQVSETKTNAQAVSVALSLKHRMDKVGYDGPLENPLYFWQILTYGFAHASIGDDFGIMHIAFNMLGLFFLGIPIEQKYGRAEFMKFYILALLFAGVVWLVVKTLGSGPQMAVGASGGVAAVVILFVLNYPKQTLLLMGIIPMPAWVLGLLFIGADVLNSLNSENRVAVEAHFGGAAFALMYYFGKWNFEWLKFGWLQRMGRRVSGKPNLKVHEPEDVDPELARQADIILDKVHRLGEESLTRKERKTLERFSKTVRKNRDT